MERLLRLSMILIISDQHDEHANVVEKKLLAKQESVFRFNLDVESLRSTKLSYSNDVWEITQGNKRFSSIDVTALWFRRAFVELLLEEKEIHDPDFLIWKNEWNKVLLGLYLSFADKPCLCPLKQSYAAENKFLQQSIAKEIGFSIPKCITSNIKSKLIEFVESCDSEAVLKLHTQDFYKVGQDYKGIYVNKVSKDDLCEFNEYSENPITLQEYVNKDFEVRYTVVDGQHFCCRIDSQSSDISKTDWRRYDIANTPYFAIIPPIEIKKKIELLMEKLNLNFGALDFIVTPNGEWYFLEINSMGQWLWIEDLTNLNISDAIVEWLILYK